MHEILVRGFHPCDNGDKTVYVKGKAVKGRWVEGYPVENEHDIYKMFIVISVRWEVDVDGTTDLLETEVVEVIPSTIGQYTGLGEVWQGDFVEFLDGKYKVIFECGAFMLAKQNSIDWRKIKNEILPYTGCDNNPRFCDNDNVISLWEIYCNFNEEEHDLSIVKVIGNIHEELIK